MSSYVNGKDFRIYVLDGGEYKGIACLTDCSFVVNADDIQITSRSTGVWANYDYTFLSWSGSASGVFFILPDAGTVGPFEMLDKQINRLKPVVRFIMFDDLGNAKEVEGSVLITSMEFSGGAEDFTVFDLSLKGTGPLTVTTTTATPAGIFDEFFDQYFE